MDAAYEERNRETRNADRLARYHAAKSHESNPDACGTS